MNPLDHFKQSPEELYRLAQPVIAPDLQPYQLEILCPLGEKTAAFSEEYRDTCDPKQADVVLDECGFIISRFTPIKTP